MPIYAYKCATCNHADDVMQKMSDAVLTACPKCGAETFAKQLTAPGFALKGSGWYVTDFRGGNNGGKSAGETTADGKSPVPPDTKSDTSTVPAAEPKGAVKHDTNAPAVPPSTPVVVAAAAAAAITATPAA